MKGDRKHIKTAADIKENIGRVVYWDDIGLKYNFLRSGVLHSYTNGIAVIDSNEMTLSEVKSLTKLRNFINE